MKKRPGTPGRFSCRKMPVPAVPGLPPHSLLRPAPARLFRGTSLRPPAFPRTLFPNLCPDDAHAPRLRSLPPPFPSRSGCFPDSSRAFPPLPAFFLHTPALPPFPGSRLSVPLLSSAARLFPLSLSFFPRRAPFSLLPAASFSSFSSAPPFSFRSRAHGSTRQIHRNFSTIFRRSRLIFSFCKKFVSFFCIQ